jgi:hypothetical protein
VRGQIQLLSKHSPAPPPPTHPAPPRPALPLHPCSKGVPCAATGRTVGACLCPPLELPSKFRRRNIQTLLALTGVAPEDLVFVSFADTSGGILPYYVALHRESQSVVVAIRGTGEGGWGWVGGWYVKRVDG